MVAATPVGVSADPGLNGSGEEAAVSDASAAKVSEAAGDQAAPIEFAPAPNAVALAYSDKYPDGLCGGVLASTAKAPLLLVRDGKTAKAAEYFETYGATEGMTFGSASVISDKTIFSIIKNATHIKAYTR